MSGLIGAAAAQLSCGAGGLRVSSVFFLSGQRHLSGYCDIHSNHCYNSNMEAKLLHIPWMVSVLYGSIPLFWFAIHPFADFWREYAPLTLFAFAADLDADHFRAGLGHLALAL